MRFDALAHVSTQVRLGAFRLRNEDVEVRCPSCSKLFKFSINTRTGVFGCFSCSARGRLASTQSPEWHSLRRRVLGAVQLSAPRASRSFALPFSLWPLSGGLIPLWGGSEKPVPSPSLVRRAYEYALRRGMSPPDIERYKVSVVPHVDRLFFPHWNKAGEIDFYMGRALDEGTKPKTLEPATHTSKPLFGLHVHEPTLDPLILVEGVFDHLATPGSVALMGSTLSRVQAEQIAKLRPEWVAVVLDPDAPGKAIQIAKMLWSVGVRAASIRVPDITLDPGALGRDTMSELVEAVRTLNRPNRLSTFVVPTTRVG